MENQRYDANFIEISREILQANAKAVVDAVKVPVIGVLKFDGYQFLLPCEFMFFYRNNLPFILFVIV